MGFLPGQTKAGAVINFEGNSRSQKTRNDIVVVTSDIFKKEVVAYLSYFSGGVIVVVYQSRTISIK